MLGSPHGQLAPHPPTHPHIAPAESGPQWDGGAPSVAAAAACPCCSSAQGGRQDGDRRCRAASPCLPAGHLRCSARLLANSSCTPQIISPLVRSPRLLKIVQNDLLQQGGHVEAQGGGRCIGLAPGEGQRVRQGRTAPGNQPTPFALPRPARLRSQQRLHAPLLGVGHGCGVDDLAPSGGDVAVGVVVVMLYSRRACGGERQQLSALISQERSQARAWLRRAAAGSGAVARYSPPCLLPALLHWQQLLVEAQHVLLLDPLVPLV